MLNALLWGYRGARAYGWPAAERDLAQEGAGYSPTCHKILVAKHWYALPASVSSPDTHKAHSQQCVQKSTHTSLNSPADSDAPKS